MTTGATLLDLAELEIDYGNTPAVRGLSMHIERGEAISVIGPNGAGKTTTLKAICGIVRIRRGTVHFQGQAIHGQPPESIVRDGIVMVPEGRRIFGTLTVAENLLLGAANRKRGEDINQDIERELDRFPILSRFYRTPAGVLSGGEQQQLAISRALMGRPTLLLLDEPSLGLAPLMVEKVFDALRSLRQEQISILLVEQNATAAVEFADRSYVLRAGRVAASGSAEELGDPALLADLYLGER